MPIFKALHILSMFTMVTLFVGGEVYYAIAIQARNVRALAWLYRNELRFHLVRVALGALVAGVIFGLRPLRTIARLSPASVYEPEVAASPPTFRTA